MELDEVKSLQDYIDSQSELIGKLTQCNDPKMVESAIHLLMRGSHTIGFRDGMEIMITT